MTTQKTFFVTNQNHNGQPNKDFDAIHLVLSNGALLDLIRAAAIYLQQNRGDHGRCRFALTFSGKLTEGDRRSPTILAEPIE